MVCIILTFALPLFTLCVACPASTGFRFAQRSYFFCAKKVSAQNPVAGWVIFLGLKSQATDNGRAYGTWRPRAKTHEDGHSASFYPSRRLRRISARWKGRARNPAKEVSYHNFLSAYKKSMQKSVAVPCIATGRPDTFPFRDRLNFAARPPTLVWLRPKERSRWLIILLIIFDPSDTKVNFTPNY